MFQIATALFAVSKEQGLPSCQPSLRNIIDGTTRFIPHSVDTYRPPKPGRHDWFPICRQPYDRRLYVQEDGACIGALMQDIQGAYFECIVLFVNDKQNTAQETGYSRGGIWPNSLTSRLYFMDRLAVSPEAVLIACKLGHHLWSKLKQETEKSYDRPMKATTYMEGREIFKNHSQQ